MGLLFFTAEYKVVGVAYSKWFDIVETTGLFLYNEAVTKFPVIGDAATWVPKL